MKGRYAGVSMSINGAILPGAARLARLPAEPAFLQRVLTAFPFPVQAIQSDGGSEFLGEFGKAVETVGLVHYFNRPNYPQGNGRVERSFRTDEEEFYQVEELPADLGGGQTALLPWDQGYETVRPHQALGYPTPDQVYQDWLPP